MADLHRPPGGFAFGLRMAGACDLERKPMNLLILVLLICLAWFIWKTK